MIKNEDADIVVKITTRDKDFPEKFLEFLKTRFDCEVKSPKMYSEDQDKFFQYIAIREKVA